MVNMVSSHECPQGFVVHLISCVFKRTKSIAFRTISHGCRHKSFFGINSNGARKTFARSYLPLQGQKTAAVHTEYVANLTATYLVPQSLNDWLTEGNCRFFVRTAPLLDPCLSMHDESPPPPCPSATQVTHKHADATKNQPVCSHQIK